ncbi:hypothetical protein NE865_01145 [Phthorimaea operculella]|nr:hypothetical protein NE865_01145 [Phthorimaea operculella]
MTSLCPRCEQDVSDNDGAKCSACLKILHYKCGGTSEAKFDKLTDDKRDSWKCPSCKSTSTKSTDAKVAEILNIVKETQHDITFLKSELKDIKSDVLENKKSISFAHDQIKDINEKVAACEGKLSKIDEVETLKTEIDNLKDNLEEQNQRSRLLMSKLKHPQTKSENLINLMEKLSVAIEFDWTKQDIEFISRVAPKDPKEAKIKPIVVKFYKKEKKDMFLSQMKKFRGIKTGSIGLPGPDHQIFASDHLTFRNKILRRKAREIVGEAGFVWSVDCKLLARKSPNSPIIRISCEKDILKLGRKP